VIFFAHGHIFVELNESNELSLLQFVFESLFKIFVSTVTYIIINASFASQEVSLIKLVFKASIYRMVFNLLSFSA